MVILCIVTFLNNCINIMTEDMLKSPCAEEAYIITFDNDSDHDKVTAVTFTYFIGYSSQGQDKEGSSW